MKHIIPLILIFITVFSCSRTENPSDFVNIPDDQLAGYVRRTLGLEESEPITHSKIKELTRLEVKYSKPYVYDLKGLDKATNLTYLQLSFPYHISDITPLAKLTKLQELYIYDSSISDLSPLAGLTQLTHLTFLRGYVEDLTPLAGLTKLTELNLGRNMVRDITPLENLTELTRLDIHDNPLSDISPLANLRNLNSLYLNNNRIINLTPLASLTQLQGLTIHYNRVSDLTPLADLSQLSFLSIHDNLISDLTPLNGLVQLNTLHFYNNPLENISALANLKNIEALVFRDPIPDISPIGEMTQLKTLKFKVPPPEIDSLAPLTQLTSLELADANISDISSLAGMTELRQLILYRNRIEDITPLSGMTKLEKLELYKNNITDISPLAGMTELTELRLDGNNIIDISPLSNLTKLSVLGLERNQIKDVKPIERLDALTVLYLKHNPVEDTSPVQKLFANNLYLNHPETIYPPERLSRRRETPYYPRVFHEHDTRSELPEGAITRLGKGGINIMRFSPDGKFFAVGSDVGLYLYDVATGNEVTLPNKKIGQVNAIAFSSDSRTIAIGGYLRPMIQLWNLETQTELTPFTIPISYTYNFDVQIYSVFALAFAVKDTTLVCVSHTGEIIYWDMTSREKIVELETDDDRDGSVLALSHDGSIFARGTGVGRGRGGPDGQISLWHTQSAGRLAKMRGHRPIWNRSKKEVGIRSLAFAPDGNTFASGSEDMTVRIWNTKKQRKHATLKGHTGWVTALAFSYDGNIIASGDTDGTVRVWDVKKKRELTELKGHINQVLAVAFTPDGNTLATGSADGTIQFWNPKNGEKIKTLSTDYTETIDDMVFSQDDTTFTTALFNNTVHRYNLNSGEKVFEFTDSIQRITHSSALSPDGTRLACHPVNGIIAFNARENWDTDKSYQGHEKIQVWNLNTKKEFPPLMQAFGKMAFSLDNKMLSCLSSADLNAWTARNGGSFSSGSSRGIYVWDIEKNNIALHLPIDNSNPSGTIVISSDGTKLVAAGSSDSTYLWDLKSNELIHTLPVDAYNLVLSNDAKLLAAKEFSGISIWDLTTGKIKRKLGSRSDMNLSTGYINGADGYALAFSPDASILCVASVVRIHSKSIDEIDLIDLETGLKLISLPGHTEPIEILKFSHDGKILASGSQDGTVLLWDWNLVLRDVQLENNWQQLSPVAD